MSPRHACRHMLLTGYARSATIDADEWPGGPDDHAHPRRAVTRHDIRMLKHAVHTYGSPSAIGDCSPPGAQFVEMEQVTRYV